jgi:hypothetical protein
MDETTYLIDSFSIGFYTTKLIFFLLEIEYIIK